MPYRGNQFTLPFYLSVAGITWTVSNAALTKDGAAFATATNTVSAIQSGWYSLVVTSAEAGADFLGVTVIPSGGTATPYNTTVRLDPDPTSFYAWPQSLYQAAPQRTLAAAVGMLTNKTEVTSALASAGSMHVAVYKADDATLWFKMTLVQSTGFDPITTLDTV